MNLIGLDRTGECKGPSRLTAWLLCAIVAACGTVAGGEEATAPGSTTTNGVEPLITLSYRRVPLERVLDYIGRASRSVNLKIAVRDEEQLEELKRMLVTVELSNVTWRTATEYLAQQYRFVVNYEQEANGVVLLERPPRITLNVRNAEIANVIKLIAAEARANIIIGPEVQGVVSFDIHDVPWKDALDSILKANGFIKVEEPSGIIRITTPERVQTQHEIRALQLRYIQPQGRTYTPSVSSHYVSRQGGSGSGDAASSLLAVLNTIKSPEGSISYEQRTNMVIIKDTATQIEEMMKVIREIDREPLQVKINVRIVSENLGDGSRKGVRWDNGLTAAISGVQWQTTFPFSGPRSEEDTVLGGFGDMGPFSPMVQGPSGPVSLDEAAGEANATGTDTYSLGTMSFQELQAVLEIVENSNRFMLIQSPEIVALDNQEATIHVGNIRRYAEFYTESLANGGTASGYREVDEPIVDGVQLLVVPHVCGETDKVILEVVPKTEEFQQFLTFGSGDGAIDLPQTSSKTVVTKMMLRSRETGVIAGLIKDQETTNVTKIPLIGDLPVIGKAFKHTERQKERENVLIFVTPTILGPNAANEFGDQIESLRDSVADLTLGTLE